MESFWDVLQKRREAVLDGVRQELALALSTTEGGALSPESLEPKLVDLVRKLSPLVAMVSVIQANGKSHDFNENSDIPVAYFEGEKATTPTSQGTYTRRSTPLKIIRSRGGATGFQQAASKKFIDSYTKELTSAAKAMAWKMEYGIMWGNAAADQYQYTGMDKSIITNRWDRNAIVTLRHLDYMIDPILSEGITDRSKLAFVMSPQMHSKISVLQTEARINVPRVTFPGGLEMETYRLIPIIDSSFIRPTSQMGALTLVNGGGGALTPATTYRYKVAAITQYGEQWASAESSTLLGGGDSSVTISWTPVAGALLYKIYRTVSNGGANTETLLVTIAALTYDGTGTVTGTVASYADLLGDAVLGTDTPLDYTNQDESIMLLNFSQDDSVELASLINENGDRVTNLVQMLPLARTKDLEEFLLLSYQALIVKGQKYNAMSRRLRVA